jgi:hypothetical protein
MHVYGSFACSKMMESIAQLSDYISWKPTEVSPRKNHVQHD